MGTSRSRSSRADPAVVLSRAELSDLLGEVERGAPVHEWRVDGVHAWPLLRLTAYSESQDVVVPGASFGTAFSNARAGARALVAWARAQVRDHARTRRPTARRDAIFLASSVGTQQLVRGQRVNPLVAPYAALLEQQGMSSGVWELAPFAEYNIPRHSPSALIQPSVHLSRLVTLTTRPRTAARHLPGFDRFLALLVEAGVTYRYAAPGALDRDMRYLRHLTRRFAGWMSHAAPSIGFVSNYGIEDQAFVLAARQRGIPTVAIQHGVQGELHPAFGRWSRVPPGGFETMPTHFWSWDEQSASAINAWTVAAGLGARAIVGGNAWADAARAGTGLGLAEVEQSLARLKRDCGEDARHILVSLDSMEYVLPERLRQLMDDAPREWWFWLRLHPANQARQAADLAEAMRGRPWHVLATPEVSESPLPLVLRQVDVHLTVTWSSVVKDAALEGVASVACTQRAAEFFPAEVRAGMLRVGEDAAALVLALRDQLARPRRGIRDTSAMGPVAARFLRRATVDSPVDVGGPGSSAIR